MIRATAEFVLSGAMMMVIFSLIVAAEIRHAKLIRGFVSRTQPQLQDISKIAQERSLNKRPRPSVAVGAGATRRA